MTVPGGHCVWTLPVGTVWYSHGKLWYERDWTYRLGLSGTPMGNCGTKGIGKIDGTLRHSNGRLWRDGDKTHQLGLLGNPQLEVVASIVWTLRTLMWHEGDWTHRLEF